MPLVLLVSYSGALGGAERILLDFAGALEGEIMLACPEGPLAPAARAVGLRVLGLRQRSLLLRGGTSTRVAAARRLAAHGLEARSLIAATAPDLVVVWGMRSALACLLGSGPGVPAAFQHNDLAPGRGIGRAVRRAARRADLVLALSETIARDLDPAGQLGERLLVVHPGVDLHRFAPGEEPPVPGQVLLLGALVPWKRPDLALEACALARRSHPHLRLRVVGTPFVEDGDELEMRLRARAQAPDLAGTVTFAGSVAEPVAELQRASCLLHCAPREPFGLAVVEALAAGCPAVVPDAGGPAEIVDATCGRRYAPGDAAAAASALVEVVGDPRLAAQLGARGRDRAREAFSVENACSRWASAIQGLAGSRRPAGATPGDLAIVTVTHNSAPELRRMLASVRRHLPGTRVVVVDSGSADESLELAREADGVEAIDLGRNAGFGTGCNAGVAAVREPVSVLLNPDVELLDDSLLTLAAQALGPQGGPRLLAPLVLDGGGRREDSVHPLPTSPADLLRALLPGGLLPRPLALPLAPWRARRARRVGWAVGCALVARTDTLRALGPFDERIFLYGEDLDLGLRARAEGIETWFCPAARLIHHRGHATARAWGREPFELLARTRHEAVRRLGPDRARLDDAAQALTFLSRGTAKRALGRPAGRERRRLEALLRARTARRGA